MSLSKRLSLHSKKMEQPTLKNVNICWDTENFFYLETSGGQKSILYLYVAHDFSTSVNKTNVAAYDSCFPA